MTVGQNKGVVGHCRCYIRPEIYYHAVCLSWAVVENMSNKNFSQCIADGIYMIPTATTATRLSSMDKWWTIKMVDIYSTGSPKLSNKKQPKTGDAGFT